MTWLEDVQARDAYLDPFSRELDTEAEADRRHLLRVVEALRSVALAYEAEHTNLVNQDNIHGTSLTCGCALCIEADTALALCDALTPPTTPEGHE